MGESGDRLEGGGVALVVDLMCLAACNVPEGGTSRQARALSGAAGLHSPSTDIACSSGMKSQRGSTDAGMLHVVFILIREHASGADSKEVAPLTTPPLSIMCVL